MKHKRKNSSKPWTSSKIFALDGTNIDSPQPLPHMSGRILYLVGWEEIESGDTTRLIQDLSQDPNNPFFSAGQGNVVFAVPSCGDDPHEIMLESPDHLLFSPAFRAFVRKAEEAGVCWLYFASPESIWPRLMLTADAMEFKTRKPGPLPMQIGVDANELQRFLGRQILRFRSHCSAAGISRAFADAYLNEVLENWFPNRPPMAQAN
ncbi:MAG: hypothetical protein WCK77_13480 [Verrucomicrobiota bacterium]